MFQILFYSSQNTFTFQQKPPRQLLLLLHPHLLQHGVRSKALEVVVEGEEAGAVVELLRKNEHTNEASCNISLAQHNVQRRDTQDTRDMQGLLEQLVLLLLCLLLRVAFHRQLKYSTIKRLELHRLQEHTIFHRILPSFN